MTGSNRDGFENSNKNPQKNKTTNKLQLKKKTIPKSQIIVEVSPKNSEHFHRSASISRGKDLSGTDAEFMLEVERAEKPRDKNRDSVQFRVINKKGTDVESYNDVSLVSPRNSENQIQKMYELSDSEMNTIKLRFYRLNQIQIELHQYLKQDKIKPLHKKTKEFLMSLKEIIFRDHQQLIFQVASKDFQSVLDLSENQVSNFINNIQKKKSKNNFSKRTQNFFDRIQKINSSVPENKTFSLIEFNQNLLLSSIEDIMSPLLAFSQSSSPIKNFDKKKNQHIGFEFIELLNQLKNNIKGLNDEEVISGSSWVFHEMIEKVYFILFKYGYIPYQEKAPKPMQLLIDRYIKKLENLESGLDLDSRGISLSGKYSLKWKVSKKKKHRDLERSQAASHSSSEGYPSVSSPSVIKYKKENETDLSSNTKYQILFHSLLRIVDYYQKNLMGRMLSFDLKIEENKKNHWNKQIQSISDFLTHAYLSNQHHAPGLLSYLNSVICEIRNSFGGKDSRLAGTLEELLNEYNGNLSSKEGLFSKPKLVSGLKLKSSSEAECIIYIENQLIHKISKLILDYLDESDSRVFGSTNQFKINAALFLNHILHTLMGELDLDSRINKLNQFLEGNLNIDVRASRSAQFKSGIDQLIRFALNKQGLSNNVESLGNGKFYSMIQEISGILELSECQSEFNLSIS